MHGGLILAMIAIQMPSTSADVRPVDFARLQEITRAAEVLCPRASNEVGGREGARWLATEADRRGYTTTEKSLLLNLCLLYSLGKSDEIERGLGTGRR